MWLGSLQGLFRRAGSLGLYLPYAYLLRVPLMLALALLLLPVLAATGLKNVLGNLFVLSPGELFWVSFAAVLATATVLVTLRVGLLYGADRFGVAPLGDSKALPIWQLLCVLAIPGVLVAYALATSVAGIPAKPLNQTIHGKMLGLVFAAASGAVVAAIVVWLFEAIRYRYADPLPEQNAAVPSTTESSVPDLLVPARLMPKMVHRKKSKDESESPRYRHKPAPGYVDPKTGRLLSGHLSALVLLMAQLLIYLLGFFFDSPQLSRGSKIPALVYLLALLTLPTWALAGAAFFLDRYRIPVLVIPVALLGLSFLWPTDHFFMFPPPSLSVTHSARSAQPTDLVQGLDGCRLTVVAASGGGIRAAGWTAQVLTGLHREVPDFAPSLRFLSAVSGGSVGAMYFVGEFAGRAGPPPATLERIVSLSMRSSLNDVAWGFAYPDLWRTFTPLVLKSATDRAWALEQAWGREWQPAKQTLHQWRNDAAEGRRPAVAFNATVVETGQRLAFGTFDTPASMKTPTFDLNYKEQDLSVITAARLSASFTYVTPVARARQDGASMWHMADGGYQDNYGVATLVDWLKAALPSSTLIDEVTDSSGRPCGASLRVAVVLIGAHEKTQTAANGGWAFQIAAPVDALLAIRTAGPKARNAMELELLAEAGLDKRLGIVCFDYANKNDDSPLSWHLSDTQRSLITERWMEKDIQGQRQSLSEFLHGDGRSAIRCPSLADSSKVGGT